VFTRVRKVTRDSTRRDNKDSEPEAQFRLFKFPKQNIKFLETCCQKHSAFP